MKYSHERWRLQVFISTAIYPAICSYDEQAFQNMSEESEKKKLYRLEIIAACFKSRHGGAGQKTWRLQTPARLPRKRLKTPYSEVAEDRLMKDIIK